MAVDSHPLDFSAPCLSPEQRPSVESATGKKKGGRGGEPRFTPSAAEDSRRAPRASRRVSSTPGTSLSAPPPSSCTSVSTPGPRRAARNGRKRRPRSVWPPRRLEMKGCESNGGVGCPASDGRGDIPRKRPLSGDPVADGPAREKGTRPPALTTHAFTIHHMFFKRLV